MHKTYSLIPLPVIKKAASGDSEALAAVIRKYHHYILALGSSIDKESLGRITSTLMLAVLKFMDD